MKEFHSASHQFLEYLKELTIVDKRLDLVMTVIFFLDTVVKSMPETSISLNYLHIKQVITGGISKANSRKRTKKAPLLTLANKILESWPEFCQPLSYLAHFV